MKEEAKMITFYYPWFGLGVPGLFLFSFVGSEFGFNGDQIIFGFLVALLTVSSLLFYYLNRDVTAKELFRGYGNVLLTGIFLGPTPVIIYLIYSFLFK